MSEFSWSKVAREGDSTMDSCYKLYSWINHTVLMLLFQILWKMSQISDYFKERSSQPSIEDRPTPIAPLTKESKLRRHIRSMSDVQSSTPYRVPFRARINSHHTLTYDSDTRARRIRTYNMQLSYDSSDSSEYEMTRKQRAIEHNILKHTDSMRVL